MKLLGKLTFMLALATFSPAALATVFSYAGPSANDVDTNPATLVNLNVADFGTITNLSLSFDVSGAFAGDSSYSLLHNATLAVAFPGDGGSAGPNPSGTYALSAFNGQELNGLWQLQIRDTTGFTDEGNDLLSWSISGNTDLVVPEPASMGLMGAGLLGFGVDARNRWRKPE